MFFHVSKAKVSDDMSIGASYSRRNSTGHLEKAEIVSLRHDDMGILHVRYRYVIEKQGKDLVSDLRTLAAKAFSEQFSSRQIC